MDFVEVTLHSTCGSHNPKIKTARIHLRAIAYVLPVRYGLDDVIEVAFNSAHTLAVEDTPRNRALLWWPIGASAKGEI